MKTSRQEWAKRVERWQDSDLTAAEFSEELGINARTLSYWKWRLGKDGSPGSRTKRPRRDRQKSVERTKPKFVEMTAALSAPGLELVVGERVVVRVPDGFEVETLRRVMTALDVREDRR
jgi:hypothetical protein